MISFFAFVWTVFPARAGMNRSQHCSGGPLRCVRLYRPSGIRQPGGAPARPGACLSGRSSKATPHTGHAGQDSISGRTNQERAGAHSAFPCWSPLRARASAVGVCLPVGPPAKSPTAPCLGRSVRWTADRPAKSNTRFIEDGGGLSYESGARRTREVSYAADNR